MADHRRHMVTSGRVVEGGEAVPLLGGPSRDVGQREERPCQQEGRCCDGCRESTWYLLDLAVLCCGISTTFCAYNGAQQIITTLLPSIGSLSLGVIYSTFAVACTVAPAVVRGMGLKAAICINLLVLSLWIASSLEPSVELAVPVAVSCGLFAAAFWTAVPTYIAIICGKYDRACEAEAEADGVATPDATASGGAQWVQSDTSGGALQPTNPSSIVTKLSATLKLAATDPRLTLMIPLFLYQGAEQAFIFSVFGSRLVAPVFGDGMVGTISVGFGVTNVVASVVLGKVTDAWGWPVPLAIGLIAQVSALAAMIAWKVFGVISIEKDATGVAAMYAIAGAWGIGDGGFNTVSSTMLGNFFPPETSGTSTEAAFANMRLWASFFTGVCFFGMPALHHHTSDQTSIAIELIVPLGMAVVATVALIVLGTRYKTTASSATTTATPSAVVKAPRNSLGMFQGVFFGAFMTTHISGNALSGIVLGSKEMHPPRHKVVELFLVYTSLGVVGFLLILLFLRRHSIIAESSSAAKVVKVSKQSIN